MRNFEERKTEIFLRSAERIEKRKAVRRKTLLGCIPAACCTVLLATVMLPGAVNKSEPEKVLETADRLSFTPPLEYGAGNFTGSTDWNDTPLYSVFVENMDGADKYSRELDDEESLDAALLIEYYDRILYTEVTDNSGAAGGVESSETGAPENEIGGGTSNSGEVNSPVGEGEENQTGGGMNGNGGSVTPNGGMNSSGGSGELPDDIRNPTGNSSGSSHYGPDYKITVTDADGSKAVYYLVDGYILISEEYRLEMILTRREADELRAALGLPE